MGLFNLFKPKEKADKDQNIDEQLSLSNEGPTEEQFIDNTDPDKVYSESRSSYTLSDILDFASIDFEERGYHDALINPETSYKSENIELLYMDLSILIKRAKNHYNHALEEMDFHINSRKDAGLIDIVNELESRKSKLLENLSIVQNLEGDESDELSLRKRIKLSYNRGFNRGLASMSKDLLLTTNSI